MFITIRDSPAIVVKYYYRQLQQNTLGYFPLNLHNAQNVPSAVPHNDYSRCGHGENITNVIYIFTQAKLKTTHLQGWAHTVFYLS